VNVPTPDQLPVASAWQLEFVRLIAFPLSPPDFHDKEWWNEVTGKQPEEYISTRKAGYRYDRGHFQEAWLSLMVEPNRIIWEARPPTVVDESGIFPTLGGPVREKLSWFAELLAPWLTTSCPPIRRLALNAKLLQPVASAKEAYQILANYLPIVNLDTNPNDFLLQINRRKGSDTVKDVPIDRVSTWSRMNIGVLMQPGMPFKWPDRCYSALELDINTAPERAVALPSGSLPRLFQELASLGADIAERGDTA
jgi:hypothetical protein